MKTFKNLKFYCCLIMSFLITIPVALKSQELISVYQPVTSLFPLDKITLVTQNQGTVKVNDSRGREYFQGFSTGKIVITITGTAGNHTAILYNKKGDPVDSASFLVNVRTLMEDGGKISEMFDLFRRGMYVYDRTGFEELKWQGKTYRYYVHWVLDNNNTARGMKYFSPYSGDMIDLLRINQEPDGMIWSFVRPNRDDYHYYETAYLPINFFKKDKEAYFVRQPNENHVEYNYVNLMYQHWKASGDHEWMKTNLECAARALDYCVTDSIRWSKRFELLKRPYCIDSWDFQVDDEYTPFTHISPTMVVVPGKTKYGIFFGDNTGYFEACHQLAEMYAFSGKKPEAEKYQKRADEILNRLIKLSWNGRFFTHFLDEDPTVNRNLGVDEKAQIAQGNMYSLNRGLSQDINKAIITTYRDLLQNLPQGSPGEWYAIYPPFERGFGSHNEKWQYMNGGVAGHGAGELARGAFECGYEDYASDILQRLTRLGKEVGDKICFAYTGSIPPPPPAPVFKQVDLKTYVNMDLWDQGGKGVFPWMNAGREGNDMRGLPVGNVTFHDIPFTVIDPAANQRKSALGISVKPGFPEKTMVEINDYAGAVYLLHSSSDNIPANIAGGITFIYSDGTVRSKYLVKGKDITNWWFPELKSSHAGVAWSGPNPVSARVGVCFAAIDNPEPLKKIAHLAFHAPLEGGIYALLAISLADRPLYIAPGLESYGGPDNWAAANAMAALVEGLAGVKDEGCAYSLPVISPRWTASATDSVNVSVCFPVSEGYIAYRYQHNSKTREIRLEVAGSGEKVKFHVLLPPGNQNALSVTTNGKKTVFRNSIIGNSCYTDFESGLPSLQNIVIAY